MNPEQLEFVKTAAHDGIFVRPFITVWKPTRRLVVPALQGVPGIAVDDVVGIVRRFKIPRLRKSARLQSACDLAIRCLSYKTMYGNFVPACNIERFDAETTEFRDKLEDAKNEIVVDLDQIMESLVKQAEKLAAVAWTGKYGHDGSPHRRFIEKYVEDYVGAVGTPEDVAARFNFRITPCNPLVEPGTSYAKMYGEQHNMAVYENLFERILNRRRALIKVLADAETTIVGSAVPPGPFHRRLLTKLQGYLWAFFYRERDPDLVELIEQFRELLIVNDAERNREAVLSYVRRIRGHLVEHVFFRTGMEVFRG